MRPIVTKVCDGILIRISLFSSFSAPSEIDLIKSRFLVESTSEVPVLPLDNIKRPNDGNEIDYNDYTSVRTDMLLINAGIRIHLFKRYTFKPYVPKTGSIQNSNPTNTRYKDSPKTGTSNKSNYKKNTSTPKTKKKTPIKIKPNGPTKDKNDRS